jgi:hypothetical protein
MFISFGEGDSAELQRSLPSPPLSSIQNRRKQRGWCAMKGGAPISEVPITADQNARCLQTVTKSILRSEREKF